MRFGILVLVTGGFIASGASPLRPARAAGAGAEQDTLHLSFAEAYRLSVEESFPIKTAEARIDRARGSQLTLSETVLPSVKLAFRFNMHEDLLQNTEGEFLNVDKQSARSGPNLQLAWRPSEILFRRAAAKADVQAAKAASVTSRRDAFWETARRYVALASSEEAVRSAQDLLGVLEEVSKQTAARVKLGLSSDLDRLRLANQLERQRETLIRAQVEQDTAMGRLALALGHSTVRPLASAGLPVADTSLSTLSDAITTALARRSDLTEARASISSSQHVRNSWSYGRLLPDLEAEVWPGFLGEDFSDRRSTFDANVQLSWTIGPGGLLDPGRLRTTNSDVRLAEIRLSETRARIIAEVREAYSAAGGADSLEAAAGRAMEAADQVLRFTRERDQRGLTVPYELVQATDSWLRSSSDFIQARAEAALARVRLRLVVGLEEK